MRGCAARVLRTLCLMVAVVTRVNAQVDPRGPVRTLPTAHFRVHFHVEHEAAARMVATFAEQAWTALSRELVSPAYPVDVLVADNVDDSNGYAQVFPSNRVVIYAVPPVSLAELRFHNDWLRLVVTHELAHIFHLDRAAGLWRAGRWIFGRNPTFFPNAFTPSWVKEGLAIHYESQITGSGRNVSTESRTVARAAARADEIPEVSRWSLSTSRFPRGQTAYAYGALTMESAARARSDSGMRRFVDETATFPVPYLLNRASRIGFGTSFSQLFATMRDSLHTLVSAMDTSGDAAWRTIASDGWYAAAPRWRTNDSLVWSASTGRDIAGLYTADIRVPGLASRIARRNALDANVPTHGDSTIFAQTELQNPYVIRSDLYAGHASRERRITNGARLTQPDVRGDGSIIAVQLMTASSRLVRVTRGGSVTPLTRSNTWAEPRWSPDGLHIAAIELLPTGEERVVVLDTVGTVQHIVTGALAVFTSPSFTPDGARLVWSSDRSGRMQLETARVLPDQTLPDTIGWREERASVRVASRVTTAVYEPSLSPDGRMVVALFYRVDGSHVAVTTLDTLGPIARNTWYPDAQRRVLPTMSSAPTATPNATPTVGATHRYSAFRQLLPRYWTPVIGQGRDGASTYGASSSSSDILQRHTWSADVEINPHTREVDASSSYRYTGLGIPVLNVDWSQAWDGTFVVQDAKGVLIGGVARRRRFATVSASFPIQRVRRTISMNIGAQYEARDFSSDVDAALGAQNSLLRSGTRYPTVFAGTSFSTLARGVKSISIEQGINIGASTSYRWREDAPSLGSWRGLLTGRGYVPLDLPGFTRHVIRTYVALAAADTKTSTEFSVGGVSGVSSELFPGVTIGDPSRLFPVRGIAPGSQRGIRAIGGTVEYRAPLVMFRDAPAPFTLFADRVSLSVFTDAARAWCPSVLAQTRTPVCERPGTRDGWIASAGAELTVDLALQYDTPYRLRLGAAAPYVRPIGVSSRGAFYVTLGSFF